MRRAAEERDHGNPPEQPRRKRRESEEEGRGVSISMLPTDVLLLVFARLTAVDLIRAGAVCVSWRKAVRTKGRRPPRTALPWLLHDDDANPMDCDFLDPNTGKTFNISLPGIHQECCYRRVIGRSDDGFLVYEELPLSRLSMINPITGAAIVLPPLPASPEFCSRVLVVRTGAGYTVVVNRHPRLFSAFADAANLETCSSVSSILDDVRMCELHTSGKKLCGLFYQREGNDVVYRFFRCDLSSPTDVKVCPFRLRCDSRSSADLWRLFPEGCRDDCEGSCPEGCCFTSHYPVVLPNGDIFVVCEAGSMVVSCPITINVYKMPTDLDGEGELVTSIGSYALFVDDHGTVALSTQDSPELKPGTIYFGGSYHPVRNAPSGWSVDKHLVMFDLEDQFYTIPEKDYNVYRMSSWFVPVF